MHVPSRESEWWDIGYDVLISEICVILHNMLIRMEQEGSFVEDAAGEYHQIDLNSHFMAADNETLEERGAEEIPERGAPLDGDSSADGDAASSSLHYFMNHL